jgi:endo-1,4-beta-xylanase
MKEVAPAMLPIGVAIRIGYLGDNTNHAIVEKHFSEIVLENEMKMQYLEPTNNGFHFTDADNYATYASTHNMGFHGHVLVWHNQIPDFMKNFSGSSTEYQALLTNHVTKVAAHFAGKVKSWDVVNEALEDDNNPSVGEGYRNSLHYEKTGNSINYIVQAFKDARNSDAMADLYYADYSIDADGTKTTNLIKLINLLQGANAPISGVSFQMHVNQTYPPISNLKSAWKKVVDLGLKVKLTELDVPLNNGWCGTGNCFTVFDYTPSVAQDHKVRYCQIVEAYLATVPQAQRGGISVWGVRDTESWLLEQADWKAQKRSDWPLLFDGAGAEKPVVDGVRAALQGLPCT